MLRALEMNEMDMVSGGHFHEPQPGSQEWDELSPMQQMQSMYSFGGDASAPAGTMEEVSVTGQRPEGSDPIWSFRGENDAGQQTILLEMTHDDMCDLLSGWGAGAISGGIVLAVGKNPYAAAAAGVAGQIIWELIDQNVGCG